MAIPALVRDLRWGILWDFDGDAFSGPAPGADCALIIRTRLKTNNRQITLKYGLWIPGPEKGHDIELSSMVNLLCWRRCEHPSYIKRVFLSKIHAIIYVILGLPMTC